MITTEFLLTSLVVVLMPGTGVLYTVSTGLFQGQRASIAAAAGCTAGIIPHLTASILGLSAILHISALAFQVIKYTGAIYLLYLAWMMWRETGALNFDAPKNKNGGLKIAVRGFLINILNPKLTMFFLAFLPLFISPETGPPIRQMLQLSATFMAMTFLVFILYGLSAHRVRAYVINSPKIIPRLQRSFAVFFATLGAKLALTEQ